MSKISFDFALTSYCQSRCRTCPRTNNATGEPEDWLTIRHVPFAKFKKNTLGFNREIEYIKFCGQTGDPMMHPDITKFIDHAFTMTNNVSVNTNGALRSSNWYTKIGNKYGKDLRIVFGIDGIDHDTNWKYREGVNFDKAWENMVAYCNSLGYVQWDFLIFEWNYHQIPLVAQLAKQINVDEVDYKINTEEHGLLDANKLPMVKEMICQANTI
jgi:MoaA/NifB/PqqE/SkfB family radical SAM enzyme